jgi:hypothetical protein|nr:MAG TPA: hypothetical protein [Bacteriophage sp.]
MNNEKREDLIIARLWLEAVDIELAHLWGNDFEVFKDHLYGRFENLTRYAQYIIEEWDRSNFIPIQLSGKIKPCDVLNDEYYMSEVYPFWGPNPENPDETVVYIFHTQGYFDRMDG